MFVDLLSFISCHNCSFCVYHIHNYFSTDSEFTGLRLLVNKNLKKMNFNRKDSLNLMEVLNDPKFVKFLKKWEEERRSSTLQINLSGTISHFKPHTIYNFN